MSQWTHPMCAYCWLATNPGRQPMRLSEEVRNIERCCWCGQETESGIYVRHNPAKLPNHRAHE